MKLTLPMALLASSLVSAQLTLPGGEPDPAHTALWAWFDAAIGVNGVAGTPPDATPVARWDDRSIQGRDLTRVDPAASRLPRFDAPATVCSTPSVRFDGDDYVWGSVGDIGRLQGPRTIFVVARVDQTDRGYVFDGSTSSGRSTLHAGESANPMRWHAFFGDVTQPAPNGDLVLGPDVGTGASLVHTLVLDQGTQEHRIGGVTVATDAHPNVFNLGGLILGARFNLALGMTGSISEMLFYDGVLAATDRDAIEGYLLARHGNQTPVPPRDLVDVFVAGDGVYPNYRIPSIVRTTAGTLLAFAEGRQGGDQSQNDIVLRRSVDGGSSWGALQVLHDDGVNALNNPCAVQITTGPNTGRILLLYQRYPQGTTIWNAAPGFIAPNIISCFLLYSDDDGLTWSGPFDVTQQFKPPQPRSVNSGPGIAIQLRHGAHAGRIVYPFNRWDLDGTWGNYAAYSNDGGATWTIGNDVPRDPAQRQGNECQIVERADGSILLNSRGAAGALNRKTALSTDGGQTWSTLADDPELIEPRCAATVLRFTDPADGFQNRILYAGPRSTSSRVNGTVHVSYDDGATWPVRRTIYGGTYAYSCLTPVDDRRFGVLFERDGYAAITFAATTTEWVSGREDCLGNGAHGGEYGVGCAGTGGATPQLSSTGCLSPGGCFTLDLSNVAPSAPAVLAFGLGQGSLPFGGGCAVLVDPFLFTAPIGVDGAGVGSLLLRIGGDSGAFAMTTQGWVLDATGPFGVIASNGVELVVF